MNIDNEMNRAMQEHSTTQAGGCDWGIIDPKKRGCRDRSNA
jgi:hypothetical protein